MFVLFVLWFVMAKVQEKNFLEKLYMALNKPKTENKAIFFRLLAVTQKAWLGIRDALATIEKAEPHPGMKKILQDVIEQINEWTSLSDALLKYNDFFSNAEIELIRSAEQMGRLPDTLDSMAKELEKFELIKKKLKSAMIYPAIVITVSIFAVIILLWKVIPTIIQIFPPGLELPAITQYVVAASHYLQNNYMTIFFVLFAVPAVFAWLYKNVIVVKIYVDKFMLKAPLFGPLIKTFYRYRFSKLLWDFYEAWLSPLVALEQMANIFTNYHYRKKLLDVKKDLEVWLEMTESFEWSWLFNPILIQIIWIWEKSGNIGGVLVQMANFYREELDGKLDWLTKAIEPLLMVFVAGIIGTIVASIFLPMATLIGSLSAW